MFNLLSKMISLNLGSSLLLSLLLYSLKTVEVRFLTLREFVLFLFHDCVIIEFMLRETHIVL